MKQQPQFIPSSVDAFSKRYLKNIIIYFFIFASGLVVGMTLSFYINDRSFNFQEKFRNGQYPVKHNPVEPNAVEPTVVIETPPVPTPPEQIEQVIPLPVQDNIIQPNTSDQIEPKPEIPLPKPEVEHTEYLPPRSAMHNMSDNELIFKALRVPANSSFPKVAFMYLSRGDLPLAPLWERFFAGYEGLFSIYVHTQPFYNGDAPPHSVFHKRRIPSKPVEWGKFSMIEAERRLLANALLDSQNQRFVLLSESCIALYNFATVYKYLIESTQTFFESYDDPSKVGRGRYNRKMKPYISLRQWRKGSQWFEVDRELAVSIITDATYYDVFRKHCTNDCYSDEHYFPTMLTMKFGYKNANRTLTWVDWSKGGPHPTKFGRFDVNLDLLRRLRTGSCTYNGKKTRICHLFARKFSNLALNRLLLYSPKALLY